jgi:hypothetical protein
MTREEPNPDDDAEMISVIRRIFDEFGRSICSDPRRIEAILRDLVPGSRVKIVALRAAVEEGIAEGLYAVRDETPPPGLGERYVRRLRDNMGLADNWASWSIRIWSSALSVPLRLPSRPPGGSRLTPSQTAWTASTADGDVDVDVESRISGLVEKATRIAADIRDNASHALALGMVATVPAEASSDQTANLIKQAAAHVRSISNENARTHACHDLSITVSSADTGCAEELALSISGLLRDDALSCLAVQLAGDDFDRALRLAESISHHGLRMYTMNQLIAMMSATAPDDAERLARLLPSEYWIAEALCQMATALRGGELGRAAALLDESESLARSVADRGARACVLGSVARARAITDLGRAAQLFDEARKLTRSLAEAVRDSVLGSLAVALADSNPDQAVGALQKLTDQSYAAGEIAKAIAPVEPARAVRLADSYLVESPQLADLALVLAANDSFRALGLARSIPSERWKLSAMVGIAVALAPQTPKRSARLLHDAEGQVARMTDDLDKVAALVDVAAAWRRWQ